MDPVLSKLQFILYERADDPNCIRLKSLIPHNMRIAVQDISKLPGKLPVWLTGVPYLIRLQDDKHFPGSLAFQELYRILEFYNKYFIVTQSIEGEQKLPLHNPLLPTSLNNNNNTSAAVPVSPISSTNITMNTANFPNVIPSSNTVPGIW